MSRLHFVMQHREFVVDIKNMVSVTRILKLAAAVLILLAVSLSAQTDSTAKPEKVRPEIAITFDELPAAQTFGPVDAKAISYMILEALKKYNVKATGFVIGQNIGDDADVLGDWLNAGHKLGSMTFSNQDINELDPENYVKEIRTGSDEIEDILSNFGQTTRYFRYPFLHYGQSSHIKKAVGGYLDSKGIIVAHATVVVEDYLYDMQLQKFGKVPDSSEYMLLLDQYLNSILDELERVEEVTMKVAGRPVKQILKLRCNRLNAMYLDDILNALKAKGYRFITLDAALKDPIYQQPESYTGTRGLGWVDMLARSKK